jgi:hypothetical protein
VWRTNQAAAKGQLNVTLQADFAGEEKITGTMSDPTNGWTADLLAYRATWDPLTNNAADSYTNKYTFVLPGFANNADGPVGYSYFLSSVTQKGIAKVGAGLGADSSRFSLTTAPVISKNGDWPVYLGMYFKPITNGAVISKHYPGAIMGWLKFVQNTNASTTNLAPVGTLNWIKVSGFGRNEHELQCRFYEPRRGCNRITPPDASSWHSRDGLEQRHGHADLERNRCDGNERFCDAGNGQQVRQDDGCRRDV